MKRKITGIVTTFNEEENIRECLGSITWVDELLVVDSFSTDKTLDIVKEYTDTIYQHEYKYASAQRNWIIPKATHEWILLLDADERCTPELRQEIETLLNQENEPEHGAYWIYRINYFLGKQIKHCHWSHSRSIRLFKRDDYRYEDVKVHGEIYPQDNIGRLKNKFLHCPYRNLGDYYKKLVRYAPWGAEKALKKGVNGDLLHIIVNPAWEFFRRYFLYLGFLDGKEGFILALLMSYTVRMKYIELWQKQRKAR